MEHIVQFGIGIDDDAIIKSVMNTAESTIINSLKQDVMNRLFDKDYYSRNADAKSDPLSTLAIKVVETCFMECKDEIVEKAAEKIADKLYRSKTGKELREKMKNNG